ncbi:hypothetical protein NPIL_262131 [Nephila pilipes]|uniref:Integrase zinc-binding domain-containing protein n=1 Tax=Nephila pilipes TaxID=299642 RepID=A0A8X6QKQ0_NEPPI|nr:hypothetical protein NPIL_147251 [Nephila pilipes]GFU43663.1 hypothetical protein NPIL_262131 [Nephila pilipes]
MGKQNVISDHFSRFPTSPVCLTVTGSRESKICLKQMRGDFCQYNFHLLKEEKPNKIVTITRNYNIYINTLVRLQNNESKSVVMIPKAMREQSLVAWHDNVGHIDAKTHFFFNLKQRYWWPRMRKDQCSKLSPPYCKCLWLIVTIADSNHTFRNCVS